MGKGVKGRGRKSKYGVREIEGKSQVGVDEKGRVEMTY